MMTTMSDSVASSAYATKTRFSSRLNTAHERRNGKAMRGLQPIDEKKMQMLEPRDHQVKQ